MKWSFDKIINKFFSYSIFLVKLIFKFLWLVLINMWHYFLYVCFHINNKSNGFFLKVFKKCCNFFLLLFISLPWLILDITYKKIILPYILPNIWKIKNKLFSKPFFRKSVFIVKSFFNIFYNLIKNIAIFFKNQLRFFFINFLFRRILKNKFEIIKLFYFLRNLVVKFIFTFFFIKHYYILYNMLFLSDLEHFVVLSRSSLSGYLNFILALLNLDNLFLSVYIIFIKVGLLNFMFSQSSIDGGWLMFSASWTRHYLDFKLNNSNFSFFHFYFWEFYQNILDLIQKLYYFDIFFYIKEISACEDNFIFFLGGSFFFSTVIISWFFLSYLGLYGIFILNLISLFAFWISLLLVAKSIFISQKIIIIKICSWVFLSLNTKIDYYFLIDTISFSFILLTTTIALFVFIYAFSYFRYEPLVDRFLLFLLSFVISMIFLVSSGNSIMMFLGWELIGFTSFCLINFWTTKTTTLKSAFKAFTFNKISDFFLFMFLVTSYCMYYTFDILSLNSQIFKYNVHIISLANFPINSNEFLALLLIGAAFIKSAQLGGHAWLPDSMEAPVPASSLIHSATLVSAGIYLILRFNFIFDSTQFSKLVIPVIGSMTAAYGGVCAVAQSDIKKTLAYSTISHCGFLMVLCSTEMNEFTILYLYVHGFFKAGVFMCVGNVLRISCGYQDTRRMGGLFKYLPFEYFCGTVGVLNLAGLPFTFGFFIKHLLFISLGTHMYLYYFILFNSFIGAFAGLFYSFRIINYTFMDFKKGNKILYLNLNKESYNSYYFTNSSKAATFSIFTLFILSYIIIYFLYKFFILSDFMFSDFMNTTINNSYYSILNSSFGYLLNFSYINISVIILFLSLYFSKFKKIPNTSNNIKTLFFIFLFLIFVFLFINLFIIIICGEIF